MPNRSTPITTKGLSWRDDEDLGQRLIILIGATEPCARHAVPAIDSVDPDGRQKPDNGRQPCPIRQLAWGFRHASHYRPLWKDRRSHTPTSSASTFRGTSQCLASGAPEKIITDECLFPARTVQRQAKPLTGASCARWLGDEQWGRHSLLPCKGHESASIARSWPRGEDPAFGFG